MERPGLTRLQAAKTPEVAKAGLAGEQRFGHKLEPGRPPIGLPDSLHDRVGQGEVIVAGYQGAATVRVRLQCAQFGPVEVEIAVLVSPGNQNGRG